MWKFRRSLQPSHKRTLFNSMIARGRLRISLVSASCSIRIMDCLKKSKIDVFVPQYIPIFRIQWFGYRAFKPRKSPTITVSNGYGGNLWVHWILISCMLKHSILLKVSVNIADVLVKCLTKNSSIISRLDCRRSFWPLVPLHWSFPATICSFVSAGKKQETVVLWIS